MGDYEQICSALKQELNNRLSIIEGYGEFIKKGQTAYISKLMVILGTKKPCLFNEGHMLLVKPILDRLSATDPSKHQALVALFEKTNGQIYDVTNGFILQDNLAQLMDDIMSVYEEEIKKPLVAIIEECKNQVLLILEAEE